MKTGTGGRSILSKSYLESVIYCEKYLFVFFWILTSREKRRNDENDGDGMVCVCVWCCVQWGVWVTFFFPIFWLRREKRRNDETTKPTVIGWCVLCVVLCSVVRLGIFFFSVVFDIDERNDETSGGVLWERQDDNEPYVETAMGDGDIQQRKLAVSISTQ